MKMRVPILFLLLAVGGVAVWLASPSLHEPAPEKQSRWSEQVNNLNDLGRYKHTTTAQYSQYATTAKNEQQATAARLFRALSRSELAHEINCADGIRRLGGHYNPPLKVVIFLGDTPSNLTTAFENETDNYDRYRHGIIERSIEAGNRYVARTMIQIAGSDMQQAQLIEEFIKGYYSGGYAVCPICGNICRTDRCNHYCPFCQTPEAEFMLFD